MANRPAFVVVIDDEPIILEVMNRMLREGGFDVLAAPSAEIAVQGLSEAGALPDVIIAKHQVLGNNVGIDAIRAIRSRIGAPVPGIIISSDTSRELIDAAGESGIRIFYKPVQSETLRNQITDICDQRDR